MSTTKIIRPKTYKYTTAEEAKEVNRQRAKQRYKEKKEEINQQHREYYQKQRQMANRLNYILQWAHLVQYPYNMQTPPPIIEDQLLQNGKIMNPI